MIITCPACETRYYAGEAALGNRARKVRCARCAHEWIFQPPPPEPGAEPPPPPAREAVPEPAAAAPRGAPIGAAGSYLARRERDGGFNLDRIASLVLALMVLAGAIAAVIQYRTQLVRLWPALGGVYSSIGLPINARGLEIRKTEWRVENRNGKPVLVVTGEIANVAESVIAVPRLNLILRDARGHELYRWSAAIANLSSIEPGAVAPFTATLENPPAEAHDIEIRLLTGR